MDQAALALFVEPCVQMLADSEVGDDLGRDFDCGAGAGVLAEPRAAVLDGEGAEASDLDSILRASVVPIFLKMASTTRSTSLCWRCGCRSAILRTNSDFVIASPF